MNSPQQPRDPWARLAAAARQVRDRKDESAPYGFATRVAALADVTPHATASLFERFALRAVGLAALLAIGSVVFTVTQTPALSIGPSASRQQSADVQTDTTADDALSALVDA